jgi:hypothetical protein
MSNASSHACTFSSLDAGAARGHPISSAIHDCALEVQSKPRFCAGSRKAEQILAGKNKSPAIATQPGCSHARTGTHKHALHGRLWLEASETLDICDFERGAFLNLYKIAHNKSTVDNWDNFPGQTPN